MKIASVSKKVLCTALSAATALAFVPATAFGASNGEQVTVMFNMNGGVTNGQSVPESVVATASTASEQNNCIALTGDYGVAGDPFGVAANYTKDGYAFSCFCVDYNNDGAYEEDVDDVVWFTGDTFSVADIPAGGTLHLFAMYEGFEIGANEDKCFVSNTPGEASKLVVVVASPEVPVSGKFTVSVEKDGETIVSKQFDGSANVPEGLELTFDAGADFSQLSDDGQATINQNLSAGTYTVKVSDGALTFSSDIQILSVTANGNGGVFKLANGQTSTTTSFLALVNQKWKLVDNLNQILCTFSSTKDTSTIGKYAYQGIVNGKVCELEGFKAGDVTVVRTENDDGYDILYGAPEQIVKADQTTIEAVYKASKQDTVKIKKSYTKTVAAKAAKKKAKTVTIKVPAGAQCSKKKASKGLTVKGKKVTLKKGAKKGTYTAKVKVKSGGTSTIVTVKFKVK